MRRPLLTLATLLLMSGCASTGSNYYSYEGRGDYYYDSPGADIVIESSGYGHGYGYGYGFAGPGFGYGYAGYGNPYSYWGYGYHPVWWVPSHPHYDPTDSRDGRAAHERASRSALSRRDTIQAPESARRFRQQQQSRASFINPYVGPGASTDRMSSSQQRAPLSRSSAPIRQSSTNHSAPSINRSVRPPPAPPRSSPPVQRSTSQRQ